VKKSAPGYRIEWVSKNGKILKTDVGLRSSFTATAAHGYIRPRVVYSRQQGDATGAEEYYAWGQPLFTDGR
jgi:hypothetical protein